MESWEFDNIVRYYKWANGFTNVNQNKLQRKLGNGLNYGMMWILLGIGFFPMLLCAIILMIHGWSEDAAFGVSFAVVYFGFGLSLELICSIERDKTEYNKEIDNRKQLNLFRDFGMEVGN